MKCEAQSVAPKLITRVIIQPVRPSPLYNNSTKELTDNEWWQYHAVHYMHHAAEN